MTRRRIAIFSIATLAIILATYAAARTQTIDLTRLRPEDLIALPDPAAALPVFEAKVEGNPSDAASLTILGGLYLRLARETGDTNFDLKAEEVLETAVALVPNYTLAQITLTSAYSAQHRFHEALELAQAVQVQDPENMDALAVIGDAHIALGNYPEAEAAYRKLAEAGASPPILARLAQLAELNGDNEGALALALQAGRAAAANGAAKQQQAWYLIRIADLYFHTGDLERAETYFEAALRLFDGYYIALAGLGQVHAARGDYDTAIEYYLRSVEAVPHTDILADLGDVYLLAGEREKAQAQYDAVLALFNETGLDNPTYFREMAGFFADRDIRLPEALRMAAADLENRKDIFAYDTAAWAAFKNGQFEQAEAWMTEALKLGTREPEMLFHAGLIAQALGNNAEARSYMELALEINPNFDAINAPMARSVLSELLAIASP
jgi:tetratricopeptide (TPR) repeat protein